VSHRRLPTVNSRVRRAVSDDDNSPGNSPGRDRTQTALNLRQSSSARYDGATPDDTVQLSEWTEEWSDVLVPKGTLTRKTPADQQSSSPSDAASAGTAGCRL